MQTCISNLAQNGYRGISGMFVPNLCWRGWLRCCSAQSGHSVVGERPCRWLWWRRHGASPGPDDHTTRPWSALPLRCSLWPSHQCWRDRTRGRRKCLLKMFVFNFRTINSLLLYGQMCPSNMTADCKRAESPLTWRLIAETELPVDHTSRHWPSPPTPSGLLT